MLIIDRFEGEFAIVELPCDVHENILRSLLPKDAKEGDVLVIRDGVYTIDSEKTGKLRTENALLQDELFN